MEAFIALKLPSIQLWSCKFLSNTLRLPNGGAPHCTASSRSFQRLPDKWHSHASVLGIMSLKGHPYRLELLEYTIRSGSPSSHTTVEYNSGTSIELVDQRPRHVILPFSIFEDKLFAAATSTS